MISGLARSGGSVLKLTIYIALFDDASWRVRIPCTAGSLRSQLMEGARSNT